MVWRKILVFAIALTILIGVSEAQIVDRIEETRGNLKILRIIKPLVEYNGQLVEPDPFFEPSDDPNYDYMVKRNYYDVYIKANPIDVKTIYRNATIGFKNVDFYIGILSLMNQTNFNVTGNKAVWDFYYEKTYSLPFVGSYTLYFNVSFVIEVYPTKLEKKLIIWDSSLPPELVVILGSLLKYREQLYYSNTTFSDGKFDVGAEVVKPVIYFNSPNGMITFNPQYVLNSTDFEVELDYSTIRSLFSSGATYPIIIDPTITYLTETELCGEITDANGDLYDVIIIEKYAKINVCQFTTSGTGYVNLTTTNTRSSRIEIYGDINGFGKGEAGAQGGSVSSGVAGISPGANSQSSGGGGACGYSNPCANTDQGASGGGGGAGVKELSTDTTSAGGDGSQADTNAPAGYGGSGYVYANKIWGGGGAGGAEAKLTAFTETGYGGSGGNGGGGVFIMSPYVYIYNATIDVSGAPGTWATGGSCAGGGGGGGAGSIAIIGTDVVIKNATLKANGGSGGGGRADVVNCVAGGGGGGGGGLILIEYYDSLTENTVSYEYSGGLAGTSSVNGNGAYTNAQNGATGQLIRRQNPNLNLVKYGSPKWRDPSHALISSNVLNINITWDDAAGYSIDTVLVEVKDYTGGANYSMTLIDPYISASENKGVYSYNATINPKGCVVWRSYANASDGVWNKTDYFIYYTSPQIWYYNGWNYRLPICVAEMSNDQLSEYQVGFNLTWSSYISPDFSDIRFTLYNGSSETETPLNYYIEKYVSGEWAYVWIKLPLIDPNSVATVFMYVNNTATSQSNPDSVFDFFDDFNDGVIDTSKWNVVSGSWVEQNGVMTLSAPGGTDQSLLLTNSFTLTNGIVEWRMRRTDNGGNSGNWMGIIARKQTATTSFDGYLIYDQDFPQQASPTVFEATIRIYTQASGIIGTSDEVFIDNVFRVWQAIINGTKIEVNVFHDDGTKIADLTVTNSDYSSGSLGLMLHKSVIGEYDWIRVRKYASQEPEVVFASYEAADYIPWIESITEPQDPSVYDPQATYEFTVLACDRDGVSDITTVKFEFDGTNYTATAMNIFNSTCQYYGYNITNLGANTYNYTWWVGDSWNLFANQSDSFTVNPRAVSLTLLLNGTSYTTKWIENTTINITGIANDTIAKIQIVSNFSQTAYGTGQVTIIESIGGQDNETFFYRVELNDTQNFTAASQEIILRMDNSQPVLIDYGDLYNGSVNYSSLQQQHKFNLTAMDVLSGIDVASVRLEFGGVNYTVDYIQINSTTYEFYKTLTGVQPGTYIVKWYVPDSVDPNWLIFSYTYEVIGQTSSGGGGGGGGGGVIVYTDVNETFEITPSTLTIFGVPGRNRDVEIQICNNVNRPITLRLEVLGMNKEDVKFKAFVIGKNKYPMQDTLVLDAKACGSVVIGINTPPQTLSFNIKISDEIGNVKTLKITIIPLGILEMLSNSLSYLGDILSWKIYIGQQQPQNFKGIFIKGNYNITLPAGWIVFGITFVVVANAMYEKRRKTFEVLVFGIAAGMLVNAIIVFFLI